MTTTFTRSIPAVAWLAFLLVSRTADAERIPEAFRQNPATFIFLPDTNGHPGTAIGTGFFVGVSKGIPGVGFVYLVTAKHVVTNGSGGFLPDVVLRSFSSNTTLVTHFVLSTNSPSRPYVHPNPGVDLVVIPVGGGGESALIGSGTIPSDLLATTNHIAKLGIREGDEMFFAGLFTPFIGRKSNIPIYRFGRLSMLTNEEIEVFKHEGPQTYFLMEADCYPGNSGSPAFFYFDARRNPNDTMVLLAGVVTSHFRNLSEIVVLQQQANNVPFALQNNGITAVVPAWRILETLDLPELKKIRGE